MKGRKMKKVLLILLSFGVGCTDIASSPTDRDNDRIPNQYDHCPDDPASPSSFISLGIECQEDTDCFMLDGETLVLNNEERTQWTGREDQSQWIFCRNNVCVHQDTALSCNMSDSDSNTRDLSVDSAGDALVGADIDMAISDAADAMVDTMPDSEPIADMMVEEDVMVVDSGPGLPPGPDFGGSGDPDMQTDGMCQINEDCVTGDVCQPARCLSGTCGTVPYPCDEGRVCRDVAGEPQCVAPVCTERADCNQTDHCNPEICEAGVCVVNPAEVPDCGDNAICSSDTGECLPLAVDCAEECVSDDTHFRACVAGECVEQERIICGDGTELDAETNMCVALPVICAPNQMACAQVDGHLVYQRCEDNAWVTDQDCGLIATARCIQDTGCLD